MQALSTLFTHAPIANSFLRNGVEIPGGRRMYNEPAFSRVSTLKESVAAPEIEIVEASYSGNNRSSPETSFGPVSLRIGSGEFFSILGPTDANNGILLRMIAGLDPATSGEIRISGGKVESVRHEVGMVFREPSLLNWRTGLENALFACEVRDLDQAKCRDQARHLLATMGISRCEDLRPPEFEAGLGQRISICRALVPCPSLLLMDDPFHCLDGLDREQLATDIQRLWLTPKITVVLCTTVINEAVQLSDRIAVTGRDGRVLQTLSIDLPRPRRMDKATTPLIAEYGSTIRTILHAGGMLA